jgi:hypothetical protein
MAIFFGPLEMFTKDSFSMMKLLERAKSSWKIIWCTKEIFPMDVPMVKDAFSIIKNMCLLFGKMER